MEIYKSANFYAKFLSISLELGDFIFLPRFLRFPLQIGCF